MKSYLYILAFVFSVSRLFSQTGMEQDCLKRIIDSTAGIDFPIYSNKILIKNDTFNFGKNQFVIPSIDDLTAKIITSGLLHPGLIASAKTDGSGKFQSPTLQYIGTVKIGNIQEIKIDGKSPTKKAFSFLVMRDHFANPFLYIFELTNNEGREETSINEFIKGAHLSAFGFCSILI